MGKNGGVNLWLRRGDLGCAFGVSALSCHSLALVGAGCAAASLRFHSSQRREMLSAWLVETLVGTEKSRCGGTDLV